MRTNMRRGYKMREAGDDYEEGYRTGYKHGWEDRENESESEEGARRRRYAD